MKAILLFLFALMSFSVSAQRPIVDDSSESKLPISERRILWQKARQYKLDVIRVNVKTPSGFTEAPLFSIKSPFPGSSSSYTFVNPDSTVLIVIALLAKDSVTFRKQLVVSLTSSTMVKHSLNGIVGHHTPPLTQIFHGLITPPV